MTIFHYKASTLGGDILEGEMPASDRMEVIKALRDKGYVPIRAEPAKAATSTRRSFRSGKKMTAEDLRQFTHDLATLLAARLPLDRALSIISTSTEKVAAKTFSQALLEGVRKGESLADACEAQAQDLPPTYVPMIRAGEASGMLDRVLIQLAANQKSSQELKTAIASATRYPIIVLIVALLTVALVFLYVVPEFRSLFDGPDADIPIATRFVFAISDFLSRFGWLMLVVMLLGIVAAGRFYRSAQGRRYLDGWVLKIPLVGDLIRKREAIRFCDTLAMLLEGGTGLLEAIDIVVAAVGNREIAKEFADLGNRVRRGENLANALAPTAALPDRAIQLIRVGEETGRLAEMMREVVRAFDLELKRDLEKNLSLIGPALTIVLGVIVAGTIGAILSAILSTYNLPI
jgi:general secretion pathway protein F